jgi:hypothetical protein
VQARIMRLELAAGGDKWISLNTAEEQSGRRDYDLARYDDPQPMADPEGDDDHIA